ncbi:esterase/lipase family protein [Vibrio lentus]
MKSKLVFVHGFYGGKDTWGKFPELLKSTADCSVSLYGFDSSYIPFFGNSTSVHQLAEGLLSELKANKCFDVEDLILVGHSLGGLVIRQLLLNLEMKKTQHNITKVAFFGVPHDGSGFANLVSNLPLLRCNKLRALNKDGTFIEQLNDQWSYANLNSKFEIMSVVGGKDAIVSSNSAKSIFRSHEVETNIDAGHVNLVKPKDENDLSFKLLKDFIQKKNLLTKYKNKTSSTYADWFKLDRHHDLGFVQDNQTKKNLHSLQQGLSSQAPLIRVTGLSGLGKSRLIIEFLELTKSYSEEDILIYDGADESKEILNSIDKAIKDNVSGLVIIETCSVGLHENIKKIVSQQSNLKVVTLNFYHEDITDCIHIKLDRLEQDQIIELLTINLPNLKEAEIKRLASFIEGFPLLADMLVKQIRENGNFDTNFTEHDLVEKLINGNGELTENHRNILKVLSLFDYIRCEKDFYKQENKEAELICQIADCSEQEFGKVITSFTKKELINRTGRFARIVPKPLALNLAMEWWNGSLFDLQSELVKQLPEQMVDSFCKQIIYLDSSLNVQGFVKNFCEGGSPFGQAELLLSKQGSRLFRALVEVNPDVTSSLLYRILQNLSDEEICNIDGGVRRNLVWALEMLVFHRSYFEKSAWCLFKLAQFENESYDNNATGQFSQLFRWQLSGTEADFLQRLVILDKVLALGVESADSVVVKAIKTALNTHGGTRTCGAEYQGTKSELKEWMPEKWQEIYDYWQSLLNILIVIAKRDHLVEEVKEIVGCQIRSLSRYKQFEMLDGFIKEMIQLTGKYWPAAAQSINTALHYDRKGMDQLQFEYLNSWDKLLSPDENSLEEKLKLRVLNPSREHVKGEDGHYIDMAAEDAKKLASELKSSIDEIVPHLQLIMSFPEQKQSWIFAKQLILEADSIDDFLDAVFDYLRNNDKTSIQFVKGSLSALSQKYPQTWREVIELFGSDLKLNKYYPEAICTGNFNSSDLDTLIRLIEEGKLLSYSASSLIYGSATDHLPEVEVADFCMSLSKIDTNSVWVALDIINMYTHGRNGLDISILKPVVLNLVLTVSFKKEDKFGHSDSYHWLQSVEKLLETEGEDFALKLCLHLIEQVGSYDVDYSDLWDYLGVAFYKAFEFHGDLIWPQVSDFFTHGKGIKQYRLMELLGSGKSYQERTACIFDLLNHEVVVEWCSDEVGLLLAGRSVSMLIDEGENKVFNPLLIKLISVYGDNKAFLSEVSANFSSRGWTGSLVPYLEADKALIQPLIENESVKVRAWALNFVEYIDDTIEYEHKRDAEDSILRG